MEIPYLARQLSLGAFCSFGKKLGYRLVGSNSEKYNAFFIRNDIAHNLFPEAELRTCLSSSKNLSLEPKEGDNFTYVKQLPWIEVWNSASISVLANYLVIPDIDNSILG